LCAFLDKNLHWNASIEDYREIIDTFADSDVEIYGIELSELDECSLPSNYYAIDHHNEKWCRPSALEQVAQLLGIELDEPQKLIAANDRGYIPALEAMKVDQEKIEEIRRLDRQVQGITQEEERKANIEIEKVEKRGDVWVLKTTLKHFSPLIDRLFLQNKRELIVYNNDSLRYTGQK